MVETGGDAELDGKALAIIGLTITEHHLPTFSECATAKAAWDKLLSSRARARRGVCSSRESSWRFTRRQESHWSSTSPVPSTCMRAQLAFIGDTINEDALIMPVLNGLPLDFDIVLAVPATPESELTLEDLLSKLLLVESRSSRPAGDNSFLAARPGFTAAAAAGPGGPEGRPAQASGAKEQRKCHQCGKVGHLKKDC